MPKAQWIAQQSAHPQGWLGHLVARVMAWDTACENAEALDALAVQPGEAVLELGCGHGRSLVSLSTRAPSSKLWGVDPSEVMRSEACRRNRAGIDSGRVRIEAGDSQRLPFDADRFDAAFSVHTLYFWPDVGEGIRELARVLRPGGRLLLAYRPDDPELRKELPASIYRLYATAELEAALSEAGFRHVETREQNDGKSALALTLARTEVQ